MYLDVRLLSSSEMLARASIYIDVCLLLSPELLARASRYLDGCLAVRRFSPERLPFRFLSFLNFPVFDVRIHLLCPFLPLFLRLSGGVGEVAPTFRLLDHFQFFSNAGLSVFLPSFPWSARPEERDLAPTLAAPEPDPQSGSQCLCPVSITPALRWATLHF